MQANAKDQPIPCNITANYETQNGALVVARKLSTATDRSGGIEK